MQKLDTIGQLTHTESRDYRRVKHRRHRASFAMCAPLLLNLPYWNERTVSLYS